jgi:diguanylate cyclase (GGDEF)-like protein
MPCCPAWPSDKVTGSSQTILRLDGKGLASDGRMNQANHKYEVLVVDDSPVHRKLVEHVLASETYSLLFACNGTEALKIYEDHAPCMVITDWVLPDFSGPELCQRIRLDKGQTYTYIILMTSMTEKDAVVKGLQAGADDYVTKPFDPAEMLARMGVGRRIVDLNRELSAKSRKLEEVARTDSLTVLPNRRAIEEWAEKQLRGAARHGFPLWVVLGDIDNFKSINDTFGHDAGDIVLKTFADVLKKNTRASDMCGRLGGDEFVLVVTHVEGAYIEATVNRFREQFAALSFPFQGKSVQVTASFGIAGTQGKEIRELGELLSRADRLLYESKRAGRNLVSVSCLPSPT